jgi:acetyl esterase/lipase
MIHGGGWHFQSKASMVGLAHVMASYNYRVVCVSYPLLAFTFFQLFMVLFLLTLLYCCFIPLELLWCWLLFVGVLSEYWRHQPWLTIQDQLESIKTQIAWLSNPNNGLATLLTQKCILMGYSCGAHSAAMIAHQTHDIVKSCVLISGVYDKETLCELYGGRQLCHAGVDDFPMNYAVPTDVHFLLINASCDLNLKKQSYLYYQRLYDAGAYVRAIVVPDTNHWTICRQWKTKRTQLLQSVLTFIQEG